MTVLPQRRYKLDSELADDERTGHPVERDEYVRARRQLLKDGVDDPQLEVRLLREEAEALRQDAGQRRGAALEPLSPADWDRHIRGEGDGLPQAAGADAIDERAAAMEQRADELERMAGEETSVEGHLEQMRAAQW